jgi:hypothetical protein
MARCRHLLLGSLKVNFLQSIWLAQNATTVFDPSLASSASSAAALALAAMEQFPRIKLTINRFTAVSCKGNSVVEQGITFTFALVLFIRTD